MLIISQKWMGLINHPSESYCCIDGMFDGRIIFKPGDVNWLQRHQTHLNTPNYLSLVLFQSNSIEN
ncbi:MAG TPA: hypothetical protein VKR58_10250, partial [Aquella sp.]|nr:hypothetical protein [Aquella sp.]